MYFDNRPVTDDWKDHFPITEETPCFFADHAVINTYTIANSNGAIKTEIEFFNSNKKLVIKTETTCFTMDIMQPDLEEPRWCENDFSQLTQPIRFYNTNSGIEGWYEFHIDNIYLTNDGTEDWYEFVLDEDDADKIAVINVKSFEFHHCGEHR